MLVKRKTGNTISTEPFPFLRAWFEERLERKEAVVSCDFDGEEPADALSSLDELGDPAVVFAKLKGVDWSFVNDDTTYLSHDIHPYPAKFIPQIPRNVITRLSLRGELVWDPFGGSGTTALEAILLGRRALSTDVNPLAAIIGRAKTLTLIKDEEDYISDFIEQLVILSNDKEGVQETLGRHRAAFSRYVPPIPNITEWFDRNAIDELAYLLWRIEQMEYPKSQVLARACFSKSVLKASFQDEETRYARRPRQVPSGSVIRLFAGNLAGAFKKIRQLAPLLRFREAEFHTIDLMLAKVSTALDAPLAPSSVDLIVTSPPYPNSNDYHLYHRFRLFWLGYDPREFGKHEIGSHLRHQREDSGFDTYLNEMTFCLSNIAHILRPGRYAVFILGDAVYKGEIYRTAEHVARVAEQVGLECVGTIDRPVHQTKRSFVSPGRRVRSEKLLVLRRREKEIETVLLRPPYTLWGYEDQIRQREIASLLGCELQTDQKGNFTARLSSLCVDRLRRLTFTHGFASPDLSRESTWQAVLENGDAFLGNSRKKDPKYATHGIHDYKGKFYPQLAKSLFNLARLQPGQRVLDPFCGSGTVLLEAYLNGLRGFGLDLNPLAVKVARAKIEILEVDPYLRDRLLARFHERLAHMETDIRWITTFPSQLHDELLSWFPKPVLGKLGWLLNEVAQVPDPRVREFLEVIVSSIVRQISQQDPRDLRVRRRAKPLEDAPVLKLFEGRFSDQRRRLQHFAQRSNRSPYRFLKAVVATGDCRRESTYMANGILPATIDAVITSPPYATALPYIDTDRLSILLLFGLASSERNAIEESLTGSREIGKKAKSRLEEQIDSGIWGPIRSNTAKAIVSEIRRLNSDANTGFRRQNMAALLYRYFADMSIAMSNINIVLTPGASALFVIGDNRTNAGGELITIESSQVLRETGEAIGWRLVDTIPITVTTEDRLHSKNSITRNDILWFRKDSY